MALRFLDGFDHYQTADLAKKWTYVRSAGSDEVISTDYSRHGRQSLLIADDVFVGISQTFSPASDIWIVGVAFRAIHSDANKAIIRLYDNATAQLTCGIDASGIIRVRRGSYDGTIIASSTNAVARYRWYYLEFKATIHNSAGAVEVRVNGTQWVSASGLDTQVSANASANRVALGGWNYLDDLYVCDGSGGVNDDFLGDVRVATIMPNGEGNQNDFLGQDADSTDNHLNVDEQSIDFPDDDTTYNESDSAGDIDLYTLEDVVLGEAAEVLGAQVNVCAKKSDAGSRTMQSVVRHDGTNYLGDAFAPSDGSYAYARTVYDQSPDLTDWTVGKVNALEAGVKIAS